MTLDIYNLKIEVGSNSLQQNVGNKEQKGDMKDRMIQSSMIQKMFRYHRPGEGNVENLHQRTASG